MTGPPTVIEISDPFAGHVARSVTKTVISPSRDESREGVAVALRLKREDAARVMPITSRNQNPSDPIQEARACQFPSGAIAASV